MRIYKVGSKRHFVVGNFERSTKQTFLIVIVHHSVIKIGTTDFVGFGVVRKHKVSFVHHIHKTILYTSAPRIAIFRFRFGVINILSYKTVEKFCLTAIAASGSTFYHFITGNKLFFLLFFLNFILVLFNIGSHLAVFERIAHISQAGFSFGYSPISRNEIRIFFDNQIVVSNCIFVLPERVVEHSTLKHCFCVCSVQFNNLIKVA